MKTSLASYGTAADRQFGYENQALSGRTLADRELWSQVLKETEPARSKYI
jgi:hypothetical protein